MTLLWTAGQRAAIDLLDRAIARARADAAEVLTRFHAGVAREPIECADELLADAQRTIARCRELEACAPQSTIDLVARVSAAIGYGQQPYARRYLDAHRMPLDAAASAVLEAFSTKM